MQPSVISQSRRRRAPVPGRSNSRRTSALVFFRAFWNLFRCCARGRAHSAAVTDRLRPSQSSARIVLFLSLALVQALLAQPITFTTLSGYAGGGSADGTG